jgi:hypothetical protein
LDVLFENAENYWSKLYDSFHPDPSTPAQPLEQRLVSKYISEIKYWIGEVEMVCNSDEFEEVVFNV